MTTLLLGINFSGEIDPERIDDACHVFRSELNAVLRANGPGPGGAWGYGEVYVRSVTVSAEESRALDILRELHRFLHPGRYPARQRPDDASDDWSPATTERVGAALERALCDDVEFRSDPACALRL
jgi:hypothetical protein